MPDGLDHWRGEVTAKLDMLAETVKAIHARQEKLADAIASMSSITGRLTDLERGHGKLMAEVSGLKATARAWGTFSGIVSGVAASIAARLWR
jgi:hypothetical protein